MAKKQPETKKRRTREHVIADLSVNFVERQVLLCGYSVERVAHDYGIDLLVFTYDDGGEVENGVIFLQLKATDKSKVLASGQALSFPIETAHLRSWLRQPMPVILIVYDAAKDVGYWLYVQAYAQKQKLVLAGKKVVKVQIPLGNRLDPAAVKSFARFKARLAVQQEDIRHEE